MEVQESEIIMPTLLSGGDTSLWLSTSSSSDDDTLFVLENRNNRKRKKLIRIENYVETVIVQYSNEEFKIHFRMYRSSAYRVIDMLGKSSFVPSHHDGRPKISAEKTFLVTVWYLSNNETFRQISDRFNITLSSVHRCLKRCLKYLLSIRSQIIVCPNAERIIVINNGFRKKKGIDSVLGAIDGSHIEILKPKEDQDSYINRKGYHSLLLQVIVDHEKKFLDIYCGEPGSLHDSRLLRKSGIYDKIARGSCPMDENFLIGDSAYPNLNWLVTPFKDNGRLTRNQRIFNYRLSATRVVVENALGLLKGRFRRLRMLDNIDLALSSQIIMGCCVLHNICIEFHDFVEADPHDYNQPDEEPLGIGVNIGVNGNKQQEVFNKMFSL